MKKPKQKMKKHWLVAKSIRFDKAKLKQAKELNQLKHLPELCRKQLDELIK